MDKSSFVHRSLKHSAVNKVESIQSFKPHLALTSAQKLSTGSFMAWVSTAEKLLYSVADLQFCPLSCAHDRLSHIYSRVHLCRPSGYILAFSTHPKNNTMELHLQSTHILKVQQLRNFNINLLFIVCKVLYTHLFIKPQVYLLHYHY